MTNHQMKNDIAVISFQLQINDINKLHLPVEYL